jgi:ornithine cyclodeaminase/alanine dehydrogenase-like protein (mu-crystallin family)
VSLIKEGAADKYREEMTAELGLNILPKRSYQEVVEGADVICTVTIGDEPMVKKEWLKKGSLVISAGSYQELDPDVALSADKIVVDHWGQASHRGELAKLVEAGKIGEKNIHAEIGETLSGKKKGRERKTKTSSPSRLGLGVPTLDVP